MKVGVFSAKRYHRESLLEANARSPVAHDLVFLEARLSPETASIGATYPAVCAFVNDRLDANVLATLAACRTHLVALRCAGFNNVDVEAARRCGIAVARVPGYSPYAVAEHTLALILTFERASTGRSAGFGRAISARGSPRHRAARQHGRDCWDGQDRGHGGAGPLRFRCHLAGYGCRPEPGLRRAGRPLCTAGRAPSCLRCGHSSLPARARDPPSARRRPDRHDAAHRPGGEHQPRRAHRHRGRRGGAQDGRLRGLAIDVYEEEDRLFFEDHSADIVQDDVFARLLTLPNVIITGHQAFFTAQALRDIATTTLENITLFDGAPQSQNRVA